MSATSMQKIKKNLIFMKCIQLFYGLFFANKDGKGFPFLVKEYCET